MASTLGEYRELSAALFGKESGATKFLDQKIVAQGADEQVIAAESQILLLLSSMHEKTESTP